MPINRLWLCKFCHNHDDIELGAKCIAEVGQHIYNALWERARVVTQLRESDLREIKQELKEILRLNRRNDES